MACFDRCFGFELPFIDGFIRQLQMSASKLVYHPLGVGWNQAVRVYDNKYLPPEGGAAALTTNSFLMLGMELGPAGHIVFCGLCGALSARERQNAR